MRPLKVDHAVSQGCHQLQLAEAPTAGCTHEAKGDKEIMIGACIVHGCCNAENFTLLKPPGGCP